ncbi:MAG: hypothetical protein EOP48_08680 [Sphingobacteriales bacterium]|nr:MAG: hypothetical protein EOP48_08680 [Sphingobacteriales bacterium]
MKEKRNAFFILSIFLLIAVPVKPLKAQDGILDEISTLYLNKLIATAKENYPQVKNQNSLVSSAKSDLSGVKISWLEPLSFQYVSRSNRASSNLVNVTTADIINGYQFGVAINPGSLLSKPSQIKKAKEQLKVAEYNREEYFLSLESEVKTRYYSYLLAQKSVIPMNNVLLDAQNNLNLLKLAYQKGETSLDQYNAATTAYNQAYISKLQAEVDFLSAKAALEELTVIKLEEIK